MHVLWLSPRPSPAGGVPGCWEAAPTPTPGACRICSAGAGAGGVLVVGWKGADDAGALGAGSCVCEVVLAACSPGRCVIAAAADDGCCPGGAAVSALEAAGAPRFKALRNSAPADPELAGARSACHCAVTGDGAAIDLAPACVLSCCTHVGGAEDLVDAGGATFAGDCMYRSQTAATKSGCVRPGAA